MTMRVIFSQQIRERYGERFYITKHMPKNKDFNEDLERFCERKISNVNHILEHGNGDELVI